MSVTDETYVSAYRGILAAKGDSVNNINEIGGNFTAGSLYNILGYNVGVLKNILNEFDYDVNGTTVTIKNGQAICYGYVGRLTSAIDFTLVAPSATDKYYFIVADFDLKSATVADFSIGLFNNNNSSSYTPTNLDNLNENSTGRYQYKMYMIKIDTSSVVTVSDLRDIRQTVKNSNLINNVNFRIENNVLKADDRILNNIVNLFTGNTEISTNTTYDLLSTISNGDIIEISALVENRACYLKFKVDLTKEQYLSSTDIFSGTTFSLVRFYGLYIDLTSSTITIGLNKSCALKIPTTQNDNVVSQWAERKLYCKIIICK